MNFKIDKVEKLPDYEAEVLGEISLDFLTECRKEAIKHLKEHIDLPGFRKGQVPDDMLVKTIGEMRILEETAEVAIGKEYSNIVIETKLRPITRPQVAVTKLAPGIPLSFKMHLILEPEFDLPDYKKIVSEVKDDNVEKRRLKMIEALTKETKIELPKKFIEQEVHHTLHHFEQDMAKAGIKLADYLKQIGKSEEEMLTAWRADITTRAKSEFILAKIAEKEGVKTYREVFEALEKAA